MPGTRADFNTRDLDILGTRFQPRVTLFSGNDVLLGWDWETSRLRSDRFRAGVPGNPLAQVSPQDNNQTDQFHALYLEDTQRLLDDRLVLRAGLRQTYGTTRFEFTPYLTGRSTGRGLRGHDRLGRRGLPGDRLGGVPGRGLLGFPGADGDGDRGGLQHLRRRPDLRQPGHPPETSEQVEVGTTLTRGASRLDVALFQNVISDRITTRSRGANSNTSDYINNPGDVVIRGIEVQSETDMIRSFGWEPGVWHWRAYANGNYNFDMKDEGARAVPSANTDRVERVYEYQLALGTRFGQAGIRYPWTIQVQGVLNGPVWYNTEENLRVPAAEPSRDYIWRKDPFVLVNLRGEVDVMPGVKLFAQVRNLFDVNYHPLFIAIAGQQPTLADLRFYNGGGGTSAPGRDVQIGLQARF